MRRLVSIAMLSAVGLLLPTVSSATLPATPTATGSSTSTIPTGWQIQSVGDDVGILIWRVPGVQCQSGGVNVLETDPSDTPADRSRLMAFLATAKAASLPVFIYWSYYSGLTTTSATGVQSSGACVITSYGFDIQS